MKHMQLNKCVQLSRNLIKAAVNHTAMVGTSSNPSSLNGPAHTVDDL